MAEKLLSKSDKESVAADLPVVGALFTRDPYAPKQQLERFYAERDTLNRKYASKKFTRAERVKRTKYNKTTNKISELMKMLPKVKTKSKRALIYRRVKVELKKIGIN